MNYINKIPLIVLISIMAFGLGIFHLIAAIAAFLLMKHSIANLDLYFYIISTPLLVFPLPIVFFNRRLSWILLVIGVSLFTVASPIIVLSGEKDSASWSAAILTFILGAVTLLILLNSKVVEETTKKESQQSPERDSVPTAR